MTERDAKTLNMTARHRFQDSLRHKKTRQGRFDAAMLHLDHPLPGGGRMLEASDGGAGAAAIYGTAEVTPLWKRLWVRDRRKLKPKARRILDVLGVDWRTVAAARTAGVSKNTVKAWKIIFKTHFRPAHIAWKRDSAS